MRWIHALISYLPDTSSITYRMCHMCAITLEFNINTIHSQLFGQQSSFFAVQVCCSVGHY